MITPKKKRKLLIDIKTKQPGCVLLQALAGCDGSFLSMTFDAEDWLTYPTDNLAIVSGTDEEWKGLAKKLRTRRLAYDNTL